MTFLVAGVPFLLPGASADVYTDAAGHYSFEFPSNWPPQNSSGADAIFLGSPQGGFSPNILALHEAEPTAQNDAAWLLGYVQRTFADVKSQLNATEVQAPKTFQTTSGRLAGDYVFERNESGLLLRQRQVIFVSAAYHTTYVLTFSDKASTYATHEPDWATAVNTFAVTAEPVIPQSTGVPDWAIPVAMIGAGLGVVGFVEFRRMGARKKREAMSQTRLQSAQPANPRALPLGSLAGPRTATMPPPSGRRLGGEPTLARTLSAASAPAASRPVVEAPDMGDGWLPAAPPPTPPRLAVQPPTPSRPSAPPVAAAISPPIVAAAPSAPAPAPLAPAAAAQTAAAPASRPSNVRCPKCKTMFPGPAARPATIECPNCGTKGVLK